MDGYGGFAFEELGRGLVAFLSEDRVVFADPSFAGTVLTLASIEDGVVVPRARIDSPMRISEDQISPWLWADRPLAQLVPVGAERVAFMVSGLAIELFDVSADTFELLARSGFGGPRITVTAAAASEDNLWVCGSHGVVGYALSRSGTAAIVGETAGLANCNGVARSPDGALLYAATNTGLQVFTIGADGAVTADRVLFPDVPFFNVRASGSRIALQEMRPQLGFATIHVYDAADFTKIVSFSNETPAGLNLGVELVSDGVLLERYRIEEGDHHTIVAEYYTLGDAGPELQSEATLLDNLSDPDFTNRDIVQFASSGGRAALQPLRRIVEVSAAGSLNLLPGMRQGAFEHVTALSDHEILASGAFSAHVLDLSNPENPKVSSSSALTADTQALAVLAGDARPDGAAELLTVTTDPLSLPLSQAADTVSVIAVGPDKVATRSSSFRIDGGPALLATGGNFLYSFAPGEGEFAVQRARVPGSANAAELEESGSESWGSLSGAGSIANRMTSRVVLSPQGNEAVLLDVHWNPRDSSGFESRIVRYVAGSNGFRAVASSVTTEEGRVLDVAFAGERVVAATSFQVRLLRRAGDRLEIQTSVDLSGFPENSTVDRLLGVQDSFLYAGVLHTSLFSSAVDPRVLALRMSDLSVAARYPLSDLARSMARAGDSLVIGTANQAVIVAPTCP